MLGFLKRLPLGLRQKLANGFRQKSAETKQTKAYEIMDVNQHTVEQVLENSDILIHGHTHRPAIHEIYNKKRIVLGDWRERSAQILEINPLAEQTELKLISWNY